MRGVSVVDVTVVVPTHNRRQLVAQAIHAILHQEGVSLELVVVDDGSTDGTGTWLDRIATTDSRIKVVHHERPRFISNARNAGIVRASGRWIAFCDDDDLWAPDKLSSQLAALRASSARWSCTGVVVVDEHLEIIGHHNVKGGEILARLLEVNTIPTGSSVVAELSLVRETGGFDPALQGSEDWDLWIKLGQHSPLAAVDRPLIAYRLGAQSLSMDVNRMRTGRSIIVDRYAALASRHGARPDGASHERYLAKQLLRGGLRLQAASVFTSLAFKYRRWRELPRAAAALVAPRLIDRVGWSRATAKVPVAWRCEAEAWIQPIRAAYRTQVRHSYVGAEVEAPGA
jgi:glycosyltransferase involved in cell wall biosynthesis